MMIGTLIKLLLAMVSILAFTLVMLDIKDFISLLKIKEIKFSYYHLLHAMGALLLIIACILAIYYIN